MATVYVALLRGVNLAGKNKLPMRDLAAMLVKAGCQDVRTYIQSGNAVFSAPPELAKRIPPLISEAIAKKFGFRAPLVLRTTKELQGVVESSPFLKSAADTKALHVGFLADRPDPRRIAALDPKRSPGDSFEVIGREVYLCLPNGMGRTKLTNAYFDSGLATISTFRNWRTVLTLLEMTK